VALVILKNNACPELYFILSTAWQTPDDLLKDYDYNAEGLKSQPEWGISLSKRSIHLLDKYRVPAFHKSSV
jgi:hypothetical protein